MESESLSHGIRRDQPLLVNSWGEERKGVTCPAPTDKISPRGTCEGKLPAMWADCEGRLLSRGRDLWAKLCSPGTRNTAEQSGVASEASAEGAFVLPRLEAPVLELLQQRWCQEQQEVGERARAGGRWLLGRARPAGLEARPGHAGDGSFLEQPGAGVGQCGEMGRAGNADGPHCPLIACVS